MDTNRPQEVKISTPQKEKKEPKKFSENYKKIEEEIKTDKIEDENQNNENEDSFSYSTLYKSSQNSFCKNSKDIELSMKRKFSNISISQSDLNYQEINSFSSEKNFISKKSFNGIQPKNLFGNDLNNNSSFNYYKETEVYLKNLEEDKKDYKKTKNYMEKEKYIQKYFSSKNEKTEFQRKNSDLKEDNKNKPIENNNNNTNEKVDSSNDTKNNNLIINNNYINHVYINPKINFKNNLNGSKYDFTMCCVGYYSVDCK